MFTHEILAALQTESALLERLAEEDTSAANTLPLLTQLRKKYSAEFAGAALETARLRHKAQTKFDRAARMFFTSDALEQATSQAVATYHALLLAPYERFADLGCGIGGDAVALGQVGQVIGIDRDDVRLQIARHNTAVYGADAHFLQADLIDPLPITHIPAAFFDPARRSDHKRIFSVNSYIPPLDIIHEWDFRAVLVKISPGVQLEELADFPAGVEFVSEGGDLKEALLHVGEIQFKGFRATRLPEGDTINSTEQDPPPLIDVPLRYLYEPDPAIIRAGVFGELVEHLQIDAYRLDETIAYLTGDRPIESPWLRYWRIDDWMPFNLKKLKKELQQRGIGNVTVKKRGSPITPEVLQQKLALKKGDKHAVVILTRLQGQPIVLISYDE